MMPTLPPGAIHHATELAVAGLTDADYPSTALPVIVNPTTRGQVMSVLFADLLERSDEVTLPTLVAIASNPMHAFAPSALDDLRLLLGADYGNDWQRWNQAVQEKLAAPK
jgi:hypothetical protein